ncbi:DUF4190 domain-containing protein [Streptomyces sp. B6B3]|uniref:DUF4190 domain-containing protein n=1 Tax=Streptomyces sp. B6B3 TaxID=3153570 RepID=UPI00325E9E05
MTDPNERPNERRPPVWSEDPSQRPGGQPPDSRKAMAALVLGIIAVVVGLFAVLFWLAAILGIAALVLGLMGLRSTPRGADNSRRLSLVGAILGAVAIVLAIIGLIVLIADDDDGDGGTNDDYSVPAESQPR